VKNQVAKAAFVGAVGLCVSATILEMYKLFPYQYSFYNELVGGFASAGGRFEIDVWRSAEREALDEIESLSLGKGEVRIYSPGGSELNYRPRFKRVKRQEDADYVIALRRVCSSDTTRHCPIKFDVLSTVGEVRRKGVMLARIYAVSGG
jgi:hypothetical protein